MLAGLYPLLIITAQQLSSRTIGRNGAFPLSSRGSRVFQVRIEHIGPDDIVRRPGHSLTGNRVRPIPEQTAFSDNILCSRCC